MARCLGYGFKHCRCAASQTGCLCQRAGGHATTSMASVVGWCGVECGSLHGDTCGLISWRPGLRAVTTRDGNTSLTTRSIRLVASCCALGRSCCGGGRSIFPEKRWSPGRNAVAGTVGNVQAKWPFGRWGCLSSANGRATTSACVSDAVSMKERTPSGVATADAGPSSE